MLPIIQLYNLRLYYMYCCYLTAVLRRTWVVGWWEVQYEPVMCTSIPESHLHPELQQKKRGQQEGSDLFSLMTSDRTKGMSWSCIRGGSGWILGKILYWEDAWALGQAVIALNLLEFKNHLDNAVTHMIWFLVVLCEAKNWTCWSTWIPANS